MATKKEAAAHDCKKDCELLHKEVAALKKEIAALKAELKKAPKGGGGADPRVDKIIKALVESSEMSRDWMEQAGLA
tara:strand:- start:945 stop:1172 length:228 start_codon:yes stop_codon:yes gene_type:complete